MDKMIKIAIVAVLIAAIAVAIAMRQNKSGSDLGDEPGDCMHCSRHDERRENSLLHGNPSGLPELGFRPRLRSKVLRFRRARL